MTASIFVIISSSPVLRYYAVVRQSAPATSGLPPMPTPPNNSPLRHVGRDPVPALLPLLKLASQWSHPRTSKSPAFPQFPEPRRCRRPPVDSAAESRVHPASRRAAHCPARP